MNAQIGNIFESQCAVLVNTVNCVGVMGKGLALEFKKKYPQMFLNYKSKCEQGDLKPGTPYLYNAKDGISILNFPTKDHWRSPSRLSYIKDGLDWFVNNYKVLGIESIAFPPLGCGNGGLNWECVGPIMYDKLHLLPIEIEIYAPYGTPEYQLSEAYLSGKDFHKSNNMVEKGSLAIRPEWYLILQVIRDLDNRKYSIKVGRTIYQKICYVLTRNGVNTGFQFLKGSYGPYSTQAKNSIVAMANANLISEKKLGKMIAISVNDNVSIYKDHYTDDEWNAVSKTVDLFGRIKDTEQAEVVATVLYAYDQIQKDNITDKDVYDYVVDWKPHWEREKQYEVCDAIQNMAMLNLMQIDYSNTSPFKETNALLFL